MSAKPYELSYWVTGVYRRRALKFAVADGAAFAASFLIALAVQFNFRIPEECRLAMPELVFWVVLAKLAAFHGFRQFFVLPDYFGLEEARRLALANVYASCALSLVDWSFLALYNPPRSTFVIDFLLTLFFVMSIRFVLRIRRQKMRARSGETPSVIKRVGIVGAGEAGVTLARELRSRKGLGLEPVAFFDDNPRKLMAKIYGIPIVGRPEMLLSGAIEDLKLDEVVISMPSAPTKRIREVIDILTRAKLKFRTVPSLTELAIGKVQVSQLRAVEVEDLLGRPPVELSTEAIRRLLAGRRVMVTGAGGSIGSELCRQIAGFEPECLVLVERSEVSMFAIEQELIGRGAGKRIKPLVVDILDKARMQRIFEEFRPEIIFHAAAHKHVPMMESQPGEAIRNNTFGTALVAELALQNGVERFVLISTDKAINPTSVMGTTKRLAEVFLQSLFAENPKGTRFMAVRFGNVLGSSGSVIPVFKRQIAAGGPVTVTHPDMTRYFMTIPEAVGLVLQSAVQGQGGEVFVLDMGKPVRILDLATQLIELSGLRAGVDIPIEFVGLRPGEKLYEELNLGIESCSPTAHPKIMRLRADAQPLSFVRENLRHFEQSVYTAGALELKRALKRAVPEYTPNLAEPIPTMTNASAGDGAAVRSA